MAAQRRLAWVPYASEAEARERLGEIPSEIELECYDRASAVIPQSLSRVEFYVLPYMAHEQALAPIPQMLNLRVVQTLTAGFEDIAERIPHSVTLCNAAGLHDASTAELALALILASGRHLDVAARAQLSGQWRPQWGSALADKRVLIVGYGRIGKAIEQRLAGFEVAAITRVARTARAPGPQQPQVYPVAQLDQLLPQADVVILIMPHTPETDLMFHAARLAKLADGALLINVGRGRLVDTAALVAETGSGRIRAALDVVDPEPLPPEHPLWRQPGVLISPHVGGASSAFAPRADALIAAQLNRWGRGETLANIVLGPGQPRR